MKQTVSLARADPDCTMRVPNPYGQQNAVLMVPLPAA
jgi:hypothetical protein